MLSSIVNAITGAKEKQIPSDGKVVCKINGKYTLMSQANLPKGDFNKISEDSFMFSTQSLLSLAD